MCALGGYVFDEKSSIETKIISIIQCSIAFILLKCKQQFECILTKINKVKNVYF